MDAKLAARHISAETRSNCVSEARSYIWTPYKFGGSTKKGIDCSGLVQNSWLAAAPIYKSRIKLPRSTYDQVSFVNWIPYSKANLARLLPGDLAFYYGNPLHPNTVEHVAMYTNTIKGTPQVIEAINQEYGVEEHSMYWSLMPCCLGLVGYHAGN